MLFGVDVKNHKQNILKPGTLIYRLLLGVNDQAYSILDGEGSGNPLQYSCLENPMDGGAW